MQPARCFGVVSGDFSKHLVQKMLFHIPHSNEVSHQYAAACEFVNIAKLSNSDHRCDKGSFSLQCEFFYACSSQRSWQNLLHKLHKYVP